MAQILNTVPISGMLAPTGTTDTYATHSDIYGQGGLRIVSSLIERNAITYSRRKAGMIVGVDINNDGNFTYYKLKKVNWDFTNNDWEEWAIGGNAINKQVVFGDPTNKLSSSENFIYDYTTQTLKLKGINDSGVNIFEITDSNDKPIVSVDTDYIFKIYDVSASNFIGFKAPTLQSDFIYTLPAVLGTTGSALINDGTGILSWGTLNMAGNKGYSEVITADGNTNTWNITHDLQTINVMVQVFNNSTKKNIEIEVLRTDLNNVQVNSPINLPAGDYTILIASMIYAGVSAPTIGGTDSSIQLNKSGVLSGEESLKYIYSLADSSKKLQIITDWGTLNTVGNYEVYTKNQNNNDKILLASLVRFNKQTSDLTPIDIKEGGLNLYSTYASQQLKASLHCGGETAAILELYDNNNQVVKISDNSYITGSLILGSTSIIDDATLGIKAANTAINIYDINDTLNLTITNKGDLITNGYIRLGNILEEDADATPGNIRYDSSVDQFLGYKSTGWAVLG